MLQSISEDYICVQIRSRMKYFILSIALTAITFTSIAQQKAVIGLWTFDQLESVKELDEKSEQMMNSMLGTAALALHKSGRYSFKMLGKEEVGRWVMAEDGKSIELWSDDGNLNLLATAGKSNLSLNMGADRGSIVFKKEGKAKEAAGAPAAKETTVAVSKEQLTGHWLIVADELRKGEKEQLKNMVPRNSYWKLNGDGTYTMELLVESEGTWELREDNTVLVMRPTDGTALYYRVTAASDASVSITKGLVAARYILQAAP